MRQKLSVVVVCALLFTVGCSSDTPFSPKPEAINGTWGETFSIPGSFFQFTLVESNGAITGTGQTCGEAGPCSTVAVTGTIGGSSVHLDFVFTQTVPTPSAESTASFDGKLVSINRLTGTFREPMVATPGGAEFKVTFQRAQ